MQNGVWSDALNQQALQWLEIMENMESAQDPLAKWFYILHVACLCHWSSFFCFFSFDGHNFATSRYPSSYLVGYGSMSTGCFRFVFGYGHIIWVMFSIRFSAFDFYFYYYYYYGYPGNLCTSWLILRVLNLIII